MKILAGKLTLFVVLLLGAQVGVSILYPAQIPPEILRFEQYLAEGVDVLYFGDSTLWYPRGSQTIPQMLQELLPGISVGEVSHAAYGMDLYASYVSALVRHENRPSLVVIPINMRSFSPEWDLRPGYQFEEEKTVLTYGVTATRLFGKPYAVFGGYKSSISTEKFWQTTVFSGTLPVGQVRDFEAQLADTPAQNSGGERFIYVQASPSEAQMQNTLVYYYLYALAADHRKLRAMLGIVETLQQNGIDVLFYITPVNVELGDVYVGEGFRQQFARNTAVVKSLLSERDVPVLDLSFDLAAFNFSDTEHLQPEGKAYVASRLAEAITSGAMNVRPVLTTPTPVPTATPIIASTSPATPATPATPANPLLATAQARATIAAGGVLPADESATGTPTPLP